MGLLTKLFAREKRMTLEEMGQLMDQAVGGFPTTTGIDINDSSAMGVMAVYAAVRLLSETIGSLPGHVMRETDAGKEKALTHPLYTILHDQANPEQTAMEWRETAMCHLLLRGNHFSEKQRDGAGRIVALWPIHPDRVRIEREGQAGPLVYLVKVPPQNTEIRLSADRILHLRGLGSNGVTGFSPLAVGRQAIALALAAQEYGARLFKNDTKPGGVLEHPSKLSKPAYDRLKASIEQEHQGLTNAHRMMILEEGMTWHQIGINPDDAQFLESRRFSVTEVARLFNVPPHLLRDLERATFSNIEHQGIDFVVNSLRPWLVRLEQRLKIELLSDSDRVTHFIKFNVDGLLRGDIKTRFDAYQVAKQNGWMNADEIRELEDLNPIPDGHGQDYWQPMNLGVVGQIPEPAPTDRQPTEAL
jgi:HK97 family phage portal protein